jgi:hypothetical protein
LREGWLLTKRMDKLGNITLWLLVVMRLWLILMEMIEILGMRRGGRYGGTRQEVRAEHGRIQEG